MGPVLASRERGVVWWLMPTISTLQRQPKGRTGRAAQCVDCVLYKCENLSPDPQNPKARHGAVHLSSRQPSNQAEGRDSRILGSSRPRSLTHTMAK